MAPPLPKLGVGFPTLATSSKLVWTDTVCSLEVSSPSAAEPLPALTPPVDTTIGEDAMDAYCGRGGGAAGVTAAGGLDWSSTPGWSSDFGACILVWRLEPSCLSKSSSTRNSWAFFRISVAVEGTSSERV